MNKKLCIIIPMFNSEDFIEQTINSILDSNLKKDLYSILIVNDGSTDNGPNIVKYIMKNNHLVNMISRENGGLSMARNTGIENTDADYIWFFDSDDTASYNLDAIEEALDDSTADVYAFQYNWLNTDNKFVGIGCHHPTVIHNKYITGRDAIMQGYTPGSVCGMLLRKDFLKRNGLRFQHGITHEDVVFTYTMLTKVSKIYFSYKIIYNYILRDNTMSRALDIPRKIKYLSDDAEVIKAFRGLSEEYKYKDRQLSEKINNYANGVLFGLVYTLFKNRKKWKKNGINKAVLDRLKKEKLYPLKLSYHSLKKHIACILLNIECLIS